MSDQYCLIGHPVAHSLSPKIHNRAFSLLGIDAVYSLCDTEADGLEETVRLLKVRGFKGWNVTMPDKSAMCALCDTLSPESRIGGSVNTVKNENSRLTGTTTDGQGFLCAVRSLGLSVPGNAFTLLGAGGAASAILIALALAGAGRIFVFCRSAHSRLHAEEIADRLQAEGSCRTEITIHCFSDADDLQACIRKSVLLVNATNVGMGSSEGTSPLPREDLLTSSCAVFDAIYHPSETALLLAAKKAGCQTANGLPMLLGQAAESFRIWTGRDMPISSLHLSL